MEGELAETMAQKLAPCLRSLEDAWPGFSVNARRMEASKTIKTEGIRAGEPRHVVERREPSTLKTGNPS